MKTIRTQIILFIGCIILCACALIMVVAIIDARSLAEQLTVSSMKMMTQELSDHMQSKLSLELTRIQEMANRTELRNSRTSLYDKAAFLSKDIQPDQVTYRYYLVVGRDGQGYTSSGKSVNISERDYFKEALQGKPAVSDLVKDLIFNQDAYIFAVPLLNEKDEITGVLALRRRPQVFVSICQSIKIGKTGCPFVISRITGNVVGGDDQSLVDNRTNFEKLAESDPAYRQIGAFVSKMRKGETGSGMYTLKGKKKYIAYMPLPDMNFAVAAQEPESDITEELWKTFIAIIIITIICIAVATIFAFAFAGSLSRVIRTVQHALSNVANGDLTMSDITQEEKNRIKSRKDELGVIGNTLTVMVESLTRTVLSIRGAAVQVQEGSEQISSSSQSVSSGASEQAASTEEMSSTIEEMTSNIRQTAENATKTSAIAKETSSNSENGGQAVGKAVEAIKQIADKISIIEDIASQTNLLALNAAIEAARAGDAGKGFAVVASEVRKLAERSQVAAGEISDLSAQTVNMAENAGTMINKVVPAVEQTAQLVDEIATASREQDNGAQQVSTAIVQLDTVVQQNASAAEEMAAMAEELSAESQRLVETINFFRLDESRANSSGSVIPKQNQEPSHPVSPAVKKGVAKPGAAGIKPAEKPVASEKSDKPERSPKKTSDLVSDKDFEEF